MEKLKGIPASPGIAIGRAFIFKSERREVVKKEIPPELIDTEINRFNQSLGKAKEFLTELMEKVRREVGEEEAKIYEAQLMMLEDESSFIEPVKKMISNKKVCAEFAVEKVLDEIIAIFKKMDNEYMRERATDVKDVKELVISFLSGKKRGVKELTTKCVIVASELLPSDIAALNKRMVLAFVTETGGSTSHVAIIARTLKIPAVVGIENLSNRVKEGDMLIVDGYEGLLLLNPTEEIVSLYQKKKKEGEVMFVELVKEAKLPATTKDGFRFKVFANVGNLEDVKKAIEYGAEGIGLLRTEFMYTERENMPTEEELFQTFLEISKLMGDKPIIIRTLDIGCDKPLPYLEMPKEANPFLGWRGIRLTLENPEILKIQFRAVLRASTKGTFKIMFPMVTTLEEVVKAKEILKEVSKELSIEKISFKEVKVGTMIETPASAMIVDILAKEVDFFSIGTNDLVQYLMAADRGNARVSGLYRPFHPAVLRMIHKIIEDAHKAGKEVGMCGEMASDPKAIPILVGMGLDEFSMSPSSIPRAKKVIRSISKKEAVNLLREVLKAKTISNVLEKVSKFRIEF